MNQLIAATSDPSAKIKKPLYAFRLHHVEKLEQNGSMAASPRSCHRMVAHNGSLYVLGGFYRRFIYPNDCRNSPQVGVVLKNLWRFTVATRNWECLSSEDILTIPHYNTEDTDDYSSDLVSNVFNKYRKSLIWHSGTGVYAFMSRRTNKRLLVQPLSEPGHILPFEVSGDVPQGDFGPSVIIGSNLYIIGGRDHSQFHADIYRLDLETKIWVRVEPIQNPFTVGDNIHQAEQERNGFYRHELAHDNNLIYVIGGIGERSPNNMEIMDAYNIVENYWIKVKTEPDPNNGYPLVRMCFSCVQLTAHNGDIQAYITGGKHTDHVSLFLADTWMLNLTTKAWKLIKSAQLAQPLHFHASAIDDDGCMYVHGGSEPNAASTNEVSKLWLKMPNLSEMCWDAICYYSAKLDKYSKEDLLCMGIPKYYVQRLNLK